MTWSDNENQSFVPLTGKITCAAAKSAVTFRGGNYSLNGETVILGKEYELNDKDVIIDLDFEPPTCEDLKWKFREV
jgi:hypothetical protein